MFTIEPAGAVELPKPTANCVQHRGIRNQKSLNCSCPLFAHLVDRCSLERSVLAWNDDAA
jgi:hypothetical protein